MSKTIKVIAALILAAAVFAGLWFGIKSAGARLTESGLKQTEENLRRGAAQCYALEGSYPESLPYLLDNYGVTVDEDRYIVHYSVFASNIMPDITVTAK